MRLLKLGQSKRQINNLQYFENFEKKYANNIKKQKLTMKILGINPERGKFIKDLFASFWESAYIDIDFVIL